MSTQIYIIRHAEAEGNLYRRIHGWYDSLITENGQRQIDALRGRFAQLTVNAVYSSDLHRTQRTAQALCAPKGLRPVLTPALREISLGVWEDMTFGGVARHARAQFRYFSAMEPSFAVDEGETFDTVRRRMEGAFFSIAQAHPGQTVALFSHGSAIRCLQGGLRGTPPGEVEGLGHSDNTGVSCYEVEGDSVTIRFENDNSHLSKEISTFARQSWWRDKPGGALDANLWFRPLLPGGADEALYREARREAWLGIHGAAVPFDGDGFYDDALRCAREDGEALLCAMLGDRPAGILQMDVRRGREQGAGYLPFVYLFPEFRRRGMGIQLIGQAVSFFRTRGRTVLRLRCAPDNQVAQHFYKKYGFYKVAEEAGSRVPLDILEKNIGYH